MSVPLFLSPQPFRPATSTAAGLMGLVPSPAIGQQTFILRGDATWVSAAAVALPDQAGASGKILSSDGVNALWSNSVGPITSSEFSGPIGGTTPLAGAFTTLSATGQLTSTVAIGTAPFVVTSTTNVPNLNASSLNGATFAAPGAIGGDTAGTGAFTEMTAASTVAAAITKTPVGYATGGNIELRFDLGSYGQIDLTANAVFTGSAGMVRGRTQILDLTNPSAGAFTLSWPGAWKLLNGTLPTSIAAGQSIRFELNCGGTTEASIIAGYSLSGFVAGVLAPANGGTGVNNGSSTLTLAGNVTHAGAYTQSFTATANTALTLPTTGTLATLAGSEALSNKAITLSSFSGTTGAFTSVTALSDSGYQAIVGQLTSGDRVGISGQASGNGTALVFFDNAQTTFRPAIFDASSHSFKISGATTTSITSTGLQGAIGATTASTGAFTTATATSLNKVAITAPATGSTLTIVDGATLTASATATVSGTNTGDQTISITGDVTASGSTGALASTVTKINGTFLAGLATGILKNTTSTGVPSIAVAADFPTLNQNTTGNAATATELQTTRTIGGSNFNGGANVTSFPAPGPIGGTTPSTVAATSVTALSNSGYQAVVGQLTSGDRVGISGQSSGSGTALVFFDNAQTTFRPAIFDASSHSLKISGVEKASVTSTGLQGAIGATAASTGAFTTVTASSTIAATGAVTGSNLSGTNTGDQTTISGNAGSATILQTGRNINGVSFNGSADITVTAAAGTLSGATLASGVTASSLTSLGTIGSLVATTADINGGTIDGTTIGATTPSTAVFTTLHQGTAGAQGLNVGFSGTAGQGFTLRDTTNSRTYFITTETATGLQINSGANPITLVGNTNVTGALSATGDITSTGGILSTTYVGNTQPFRVGGTTTASIMARISNTGGDAIFGMERSAGSEFIVGSTGYDTVVRGPSGIAFSANAGSNMQMRLSATGLAVTGAVSGSAPSAGATTFTATSNGVTGINHPLYTFQRSGGAVAGEITYEGVGATMNLWTTTAHNLVLGYNRTAIAAISSTGLAVTGALSATGNLTLSAANSNILGGTSTGSSSIFNSTGASGFTIYGPTHATKANQIDVFAGGLGHTFNSTGLAVTGALSATGNILGSGTYVGTSDSTYPLTQANGIGAAFRQLAATQNYGVDFRRWTGSATEHSVAYIGQYGDGLGKFPIGIYYDSAKTTNTQATTRIVSIDQNGLAVTGALSATGRVSTLAGTNVTLTNSRNDNVAIGTAGFFRFLGGGASAEISGMAAGTDGQQITVFNATGSNIVFLYDDANSTAANRIYVDGGVSITLANAGAIAFIYLAVSSRWVFVGKP